MTEESQRSSSTNVFPLTSLQPVKRVIPLRGLSGDTAAGIVDWRFGEDKGASCSFYLSGCGTAEEFVFGGLFEGRCRKHIIWLGSRINEPR